MVASATTVENRGLYICAGSASVIGPSFALCGSIIAIFATLTLAILRLNHGIFSYTLDDAYIELRLGEQLRHFHYGINSTEVSSPASSIVFPLLLAPAADFSWYGYVPLGINLLCLLLSALIIADCARKCGLGSFAAGALALVLCTVFNLFGVAFTGLEHSLQTLLTLAMLQGVMTLRARSKVPVWLDAAAISAPFVRFEGLASSGAYLLILWGAGRRAHALSTAGILGFMLLAFATIMHHASLPIIPASAQAKSAIAGSLVTDQRLSLTPLIIQNFAHNLSTRNGSLLILIASGLALHLVARMRAPSSETDVALFTILITVAQLGAGNFGWLDRYETYVLAPAVISVVCVYRRQWHTALENSPTLATAGIFALLLIAGLPMIRLFFRIPGFAHSVYLQQYQMHRLAVEFIKQPVAVNDLGWVSYRNPNSVIDLVGLTSQETRHIRETRSARALEALLARNHVSLVMIYPEWFDHMIPDSLTPLAELISRCTICAPAFRRVVLFATPSADSQALRTTLEAFGRSLPPEAELRFAARNHAPVQHGAGGVPASGVSATAQDP